MKGFRGACVFECAAWFGRCCGSVAVALALASAMGAGGLRAGELPPGQDLPWGASLPSGTVTWGISAGDQQTETLGDILLPLAGDVTHLVFINPRGTTDDRGGREVNIGLGGRTLFPERNYIAGVNCYYDHRESALDNRFNQFGVGAEFLTPWVDLRANAYLPSGHESTMDQYATETASLRETTSHWADPTGEGHLITQSGYDNADVYQVKTTRHYSRAEQAMEGVDAEVGSLLPIPRVRDVADVRLFAGFYDFNAHYGKDLAGMKARVEIRPLPPVIVDAGWYEDRELYGSRYTVGIRASLPFDLARLSHGKNPFAGALEGFRPCPGKVAFASRMTDMVVRDLHIRTDFSPLAEVVADRQVERTLVSHTHHDYHDILAEAVTFVDGDTQAPLQNGTWENPYAAINAGVQNAVGTMVYVRDAARAYSESVVLKPGQTLWGSGAVIRGRGNRFMGGIYPVLNSDGTGPAVTLANHVTVAGMGIVQADWAVPQFGIYGHNATGITLSDNIVEGRGAMPAGVRLEADAILGFSADLVHNRISGMQGTGMSLDLVDVGEMDLVLVGNETSGNGGDGIGVDATLTTSGGRLVVDSLLASANQMNGVRLDINAFGGAVAASLHDVVAESNGRSGVSGFLWGIDGLALSVAGSRLSRNRDSGMLMECYTAGTFTSEFLSNELAGNAFHGLALTFDSGLLSTVTGRGNRFVDNGAVGLGLVCSAPLGDFDFGTPSSPGMNWLFGNGVFQMAAFGLTDPLSAQGNWWGSPSPVPGVDYVAAGGDGIDAANPLPAP